MKIVYFIDHLRSDGTQQALRQLTEGLAIRGHEQAVVCFNNSWDATVINSLHEVQTSTRFVGKLALVTGYGLLSTWYWLHRERFDVAVTFLFYSDVFGRALARMSRIPRIISSLRARNIHYRQWQRFLVRCTMPWTDMVVLNSSAISEFAIAQEGARSKQIVVIPNGVCIDNYTHSADRTSLRAEFGIPAERQLLCSVGRLTHQKGLDVLLVALAKIADRNVDLILVGTGEEEMRLRAQAVALGLMERVHFAGYRHDLPKVLGAFDVYVHPARFEGMPNALLEAMAAGCPIVASAVDGNRELIEDGVHGWLVPPDDPAALAKAMDSALHNRREAERRAQAAYERVVAKFSVEAMVGAWEAALRGDTQ